MSQKTRLHRVTLPAHFNASDPAHCAACRKAVAARLSQVRARPNPLRMAKAPLRGTR